MDTEKIEQLIEIVKDSEVSEISLESRGAKVKIRKGRVHRSAPAKAKAAPASASTGKKAAPVQGGEKSGPNEVVVSAPMVGIFHSFNGSVAVGSIIKSGQVVGSIESMKLMNDVMSDADGTVTEVLVEDGMPVEYGQVLLRLACN